MSAVDNVYVEADNNLSVDDKIGRKLTIICR